MIWIILNSKTVPRFYVDCQEKSLEDFATDKAHAENLWNVSEDIVGDITILGGANIKTVKVAEVKETSNIPSTESKDVDRRSSESDNDENGQELPLKTERIETVKVAEAKDTSNIICTVSKDEDRSSSESENDENDQKLSLKTESNELTMKNMMNYQEGNTQSILEGNLRTTTVTRRVVKTVISSSQVSSAQNNITITEI